MKPAATTTTAALIIGTTINTAHAVDHSQLDAILRANVRNERVDYANIRDNHKSTLSAYLDTLAKVDPADLPRNEQLAYYINLYNATVIHTILDRYNPGYSVSEDNFKIFDEKHCRTATATATFSLNHLENKIIRPTFKDPRIHAALNCAAASCPPIHNRAFTSATLDATLTHLMRAFVNDASRNTIDMKSRTLTLSKIFEWYAVDFGDKKGLAKYVNQYTDKDVSSYTVTFQDYSWKLNDTM